MKHLIFYFTFVALSYTARPALSNGLFFSTLTVRDGLPSNVVSSVCQDQHGFIWVGTDVGLARFDGYGFKYFKKSQSPQSLPSDEISVLAQSGNYIWVGTWNGLCKVNSQTFEIERVNIGTSKAVRSLHVGENNVLWVGTNNGLIRLNILTEEHSMLNQHNAGLSHNTIRSIYEDAGGNLWVGTYDGLNILHKNERLFKRIELEPVGSDLIDNHLVLDIQNAPGQGFVWVGTEVGLFKVSVSSYKATPVTAKDNFSNSVIKSIYVDRSGELWLGSDFGLNIFNPNTRSNAAYFHNPNAAYSLANNVVWQIFEDSGGVLWLVTSNGLSRCNRKGEFYQYHDISYEIDGQIIGNHIRSFFVGSDSTYWLATQNGVLNIIPAEDFKSKSQDGLNIRHRIALNNVYALEEDKQGKIWIGSAGGIYIWDPQEEKLSQIKAEGDKNGLNSNYIGKFSKQEDGTMWVSAWEGGIFKIDGLNSNFIQFKPIKGMQSSSELHTYARGYLWVIDNGVLYKVDTASLNSIKVHQFADGLSNQMIYSIYFSKQGNFWAGTMNGLLMYDPQADTTTHYEIKSSKNIIISSIIEDDEGNIWSAASTALYKFYPKNGSFEVYPLDENLPISAFYYGCAAKGAKGQLIFGGDNGYIVFDPKDANPNTYHPPVYFISLEVNNQPVNVGPSDQKGGLVDTDIAFSKNLVLQYESRSFVLEFAALHYWQPESNIYSYKLEGFDENWSHVSDRRNFAAYSNLPAGDYRLVVKGSNNYGVESDQAAMINIRVKPPLFLSHGFIALYVLVGIALTAYLLRTYFARVNLKNELKISRIEKEHAEEIERTKERFFTNISHELRTPISLILPPILEIKKKGNIDEFSRNLITLAEKNAVRLLRLVNQILDFNKLGVDSLHLKVSEIEMVNFCKEIFSLFTDQSKRKKINFILNCEPGQTTAWIDAEKIETALFNLLSNAFKFTQPGGRIEVTLSLATDAVAYKEGAFQIQVKDSGVGIAQEEQLRIFERFYQAHDGRSKDSGSGIGLTLVAEYVELHGGFIHLNSEAGKGAEFTITLPLGKAHLPTESIHEDAQEKLDTTPSSYVNGTSSTLYQLNPDSDKPLVLLIEDNPDMIDFIQTSLSHKFTFIIAQDGQEGIKKANSFNPAVIVSDIMMPNMDGIELCCKLKKNPQTTHISIIFISAKSMTENRVEGMKVGADAYIVKPFEIALLEAQIETLIQRQKELMEYFQNDLIRLPAQSDTSNNEDNKFVKKVMDIIEANISNSELTVELIAGEMAMSTTHLYRRLKATTDHSTKEIIQKYRLKRATQLLHNKEGNVTEIMYRVGFTNSSYFSKCFKAEYKLSPKQYQERVSG